MYLAFCEMQELSKNPWHTPCGFPLVFFIKKTSSVSWGSGDYTPMQINHRDNFVIALCHAALGLHWFILLHHKFKTLSSSWRCFLKLFFQSSSLKLFFPYPHTSQLLSFTKNSKILPASPTLYNLSFCPFLPSLKWFMRPLLCAV